MKKYRMTDKTITLTDGTVLHQIKALRDIRHGSIDVNKGETGGWIEKEANLSQLGDCWVSGNAYVYGNAKIVDDAHVNGESKVIGRKPDMFPVVCENAIVGGNAELVNEVRAFGHALIGGDVMIHSVSWITSDKDIVEFDTGIERYGKVTFTRDADGDIYAATNYEVRWPIKALKLWAKRLKGCAEGDALTAAAEYAEEHLDTLPIKKRIATQAAKKYVLTGETMTLEDGTVLHRIRALAPICESNGSEIVGKGELGGWIEHEGNLSQSGNCWVFDNAKVYGNAKVTQHAWIKDNAVIKDNAHIYEWATVCFDGVVGGNVKMGGAGYFTGEVNKK